MRLALTGSLNVVFKNMPSAAILIFLKKVFSSEQLFTPTSSRT